MLQSIFVMIIDMSDAAISGGHYFTLITGNIITDYKNSGIYGPRSTVQ